MKKASRKIKLSPLQILLAVSILWLILFIFYGLLTDVLHLPGVPLLEKLQYLYWDTFPSLFSILIAFVNIVRGGFEYKAEKSQGEQAKDSLIYTVVSIAAFAVHLSAYRWILFTRLAMI